MSRRLISTRNRHRYISALLEFVFGPRTLPKGCGAVTCSALVNNRFLCRVESFEDFGEQRFDLTLKGWAALAEEFLMPHE